MLNRLRRLSELEEMHLSYILLHVQNRDPDPRPFRTFADSWFAYHRSAQGGDFVNESFTPLWMNRGDLTDLPPRCRQVHAISCLAERVLDRIAPFQPLVRDHSVPLKRVRAELLQAGPTNVPEVRELMLRWYRCAVITDAEHGMLRGRLNGAMPDEWAHSGSDTPSVNCFARYEAVNIPYRIIRDLDGTNCS